MAIRSVIIGICVATIAFLMVKKVNIQGKLTKKPIDQIAILGSKNLSLVCQSDMNHSIDWKFTPVGAEGASYLYELGHPAGINQANNLSYGLDNSIPGASTLIIWNSMYKHAGLYMCIDDEGYGENASALFTVIAEKPICEITNDTRKFTTVFCNLTLSGKIMPELHCAYDDQLNAVNNTIRHIKEDNDFEHIEMTSVFPGFDPALYPNMSCYLLIKNNSLFHGILLREQAEEEKPAPANEGWRGVLIATFVTIFLVVLFVVFIVVACKYTREDIGSAISSVINNYRRLFE